MSTTVTTSTDSPLQAAVIGTIPAAIIGYHLANGRGALVAVGIMVAWNVTLFAVFRR